MSERCTPLTVRTSARAGMFVQHKFSDNSREGIRTSRALGDGRDQAGKRRGSAAAGATRRRRTHSLCVGLTAGGWPTRLRRAASNTSTSQRRKTTRKCFRALHVCVSSSRRETDVHVGCALGRAGGDARDVGACLEESAAPCQRHVAGRDGQRACQLASTPGRRPRLVVRLGDATTWAGLVSLGGGRMWGHVSSRQGPVRPCQCHVACLLGQPVPACVGARLWQDSSSDWALQRGQSWRCLAGAVGGGLSPKD